MLKSLGLPDFSLDHWKSRIRGRVRVHDQYRDIANWTGVETADIVYPDNSSILTKSLIDRGYLEAAVWRDRTPTYYIEVKATPGPLETQFYCSQAQVNRMDGMQLPGASPSMNNVYLIVR